VADERALRRGKTVHPYWGVRIITGPDAWWLGDERGAYTMDQFEAERIASIMNIRSNEMYFIVKAYRSTTPMVDEHTNPRVSYDPPPRGARAPAEVFGRDLPHYRYAAAPITHLTTFHPPATNLRKILLPPAHGRPGHDPGQRTRKRPHPGRRTC
jgi:hypothetical protein